MLSKRAKLSGYKEFVLDEHYTVEAHYWETPWSWGHYAKLFRDGQYRAEEKIVYQNRTWESYTYQSVVHGVLNKAGLLKEFKDKADEIGAGNVKKELKAMGALVAFAGLLQPDNKVEAEIGALEAVTGGAVSRPDDWDKLSEEEKQERLRKALDVLN